MSHLVCHAVSAFCAASTLINDNNNCFANRVCNVWNSLPDFVVSAQTVDVFKGRFDALSCTLEWNGQDVKYSWCEELTGAEDRSHV